MAGEMEHAAARLNAALGRLDGALARRLGAVRSADLETELQVMQDDRARLALELESASARLHRMESAASHLGRRVESAIASVEAALGDESGEPEEA